MAALTRPAQIIVRAAFPGEGAAVAALWRELWDAHEVWGGYPGSRDPRVYAQLAHRLDDDVRVRGGHPILGRHVHLVADVDGRPCGQVEGWFDRQGVESPYTCEVRSLIVSERVRGLGAGRALLEALGGAARSLSREAPCVLAAEVLEPNPAHAFYDRVGYSPVAWCARIDSAPGASAVGSGRARAAVPHDALAMARLESALAARRRDAGDLRFDRPRAIDATLVGAIAAHLATHPASAAGSSLREPVTLVGLDPGGVVRASASFTVHPLEPPFVPMRRALLGRFAVDPALPPQPFVAPLVALGCRMALAQGAPHVELTDLSAPGTDLHVAALATGARPWSRVVTRMA
jgi:GNAT superfamily N-acetyltransferase